MKKTFKNMIALIINCSPVRTGATAEIVKTVAEQLSARYEVRSICIEHFYGHLEIECMGHLGLTSVEYKTDVEPRKNEIIEFCSNI